jgi:hypothetical protein
MSTEENTMVNRRVLLKGAAAAGLGSVLAGSSLSLPAHAETSAPLFSISKELWRLWNEAPSLPGIISVKEQLEASYPTDLSPDDSELLAGAVYLQAAHSAKVFQNGLTPSTIQHTLQSPFAWERLSPSYFPDLLAEARSASADPVVAQTLREAAQASRDLARDIGADENEPAGCIILIYLLGVAVGIFVAWLIWG